MRFHKYINESNIIQSKNFVKNVEDFVFTNDKKYIDKIAKYKKDIPNIFRKPTILYRGMTLNQQTMTLNQQTFDNLPLKLNNYSSWTSDKNTAIKFVNDKSKKISNKSGIKVIFKKKLSKEIILDVSSYAMTLDMMGILDKFEFDEITKDSALKEKEFICDKNIILTDKDIEKIIK